MRWGRPHSVTGVLSLQARPTAVGVRQSLEQRARGHALMTALHVLSRHAATILLLNCLEEWGRRTGHDTSTQADHDIIM